MYLVNVLKYEICDGQLSFRGKKVLEVIIHYSNFKSGDLIVHD